MKPLGTNQIRILKALERHHSFHGGCGWFLDNYSTTVRILETLVKRGLVAKEARPNWVNYTIAKP